MERAQNVRDVVCLTVAGSATCLQHPRLLELDDRLRVHGRQLILVFANAQWALLPNGTNFGFTGRSLMYHPRAKDLVDQRLGEFAASMVRTMRERERARE
jgi:hypothetical protein